MLLALCFAGHQVCLRVLEATLPYCYIPSENLSQFTACLCCIVNRDRVAQQTWTVSYTPFMFDERANIRVLPNHSFISSFSDSSLIQSGTSLNSMAVRVRIMDELHLWLWWTLATKDRYKKIKLAHTQYKR